MGERAIGEIRKRDAIALVDRIADRGAPVMADRTLAHVKRLFRWAAARDIAGFVVPAQADQVQVETADGRRLNVRAVHRLSGTSVGVAETYAPVLLKVDLADAVPLALAPNLPLEGERILAIGSTETGFLIPEFGTVTGVDTTEIDYHRSSERLRGGFGGGPLLNDAGEVVGLHLGVEPAPTSEYSKRLMEHAKRLGMAVSTPAPAAEGGAAFALRLDIWQDQLAALGVRASPSAPASP